MSSMICGKREKNLRRRGEPRRYAGQGTLGTNADKTKNRLVTWRKPCYNIPINTNIPRDTAEGGF